MMTKNVLIIGGASGIGMQVAKQMVAQSYRVTVADIAEDLLKSVSTELHCESVLVDVQDSSQIEKAVQIAAGKGSLDIAINCAGIEGDVDFLVHQRDAMLARVMQVNALGTLLALKYELRQMIKQGHGAICSISSIYGMAGQPRWAAYCASKHAVIGATLAASLEVAHLGIRVNAVAPGPIHTPLLDRATGGNPMHPAGFVPMRQLGQPADVAQAVGWLCSDEARYITGVVLPVDGGANAQLATTPDFSTVSFNL